MRYRWIVVCVVVAVCFGGAVAQRTSASSSARIERISTQVQEITMRGHPHDVVRVIISLTSAPSIAPRMVPFVQQQRIRAVRQVQRGFVVRHAAYLNAPVHQPTLYPVVMATMRRHDVDRLVSDDEVIAVEEDVFMPMLVHRSSTIIGATTVNSSGYDGQGTSIAVLDTGVRKTHEFLAGKVVAEACFSNYWGNETSLCPSGSNTTLDVSNDIDSATPCSGVANCDHGTHVAGIAAGNIITRSGTTYRGVAPAASIIAVQVFTYSAGSLGTYTANQVMAFDWLLTHMNTPEWGTLAAINMSLGSGLFSAACDGGSSLTRYINDMRALGVATVVAVGNNGHSAAIARPACVSSAVAVGSSTSGIMVLDEDEVSSFSNSIPAAANAPNENGDRLIDLLAPGEAIKSSVAWSTTAYDYKQGTSMAAPQVAGAWAVMRQYAPLASVSQILSWLYRSGTYLIDSRNSVSLPRISIPNAIRLATTAMSMTVTPTRTQTLTPTNTPTPSQTATPTTPPTVTPTPVPSVTRPLVPSRTPSMTHISTKTATPHKPGPFTKRIPLHLATNQPVNLTLAWHLSPLAKSYEYCIATSGPACTNWRNVGLTRSVVVRGLARNTTYVWQVRARNQTGVTIAIDGRWRFTTTR